jgi:hypothetical protein
MKRIIVGAAFALGALAAALSPAAADAKKQVRGLETQRTASAPARLRDDASTRKVSTSGYRVGLDGRTEFCVGF